MKPFRFAVFAALAAGAVAACSTLGGGSLGGLLGGGTPVPMEADPKYPASEGTVSFSKAANENTGIDLSVKHLAYPEKLTPPARSYVVWLRAGKDGPPQNIGSLIVDKNLNGHLSTVTAQRDFELFVTAEQAGDVQRPAGQAMLWARHHPD